MRHPVGICLHANPQTLKRVCSMCGRFGIELPAAEIASIFGTHNGLPNIPANYNAAPTQILPVIHREERERIIGMYRWGLIPSWAKDVSIGARAINARAETLETKPMFKTPLKSRRCLVPASLFIEWTGEKGAKQPHAIAMADKSPLAFAGLWEAWKHPESGERLRSFTIITTTPNETVAPIHDRMPVILPQEAWEVWLGEETTPETLNGLLCPYTASKMVAWDISPAINIVKNNHGDLWLPLNSA